MSTPSNFFVQVQEWAFAGLAFLGNYGAAIHESNKLFENFNTLTANRGDTVNFELTPRYSSNEGLVAVDQPTTQRLASLTCSEAQNVSFAMTSNQFLFNMSDYLPRAVKGAVEELASKIEENVLQVAETSPYRFFGDGYTPLNSYPQLAQMIAFYRNYGAPRGNVKVFLPDLIEPQITGSGQNQFVMRRNEETAHNWVVGDFSDAEFFRTNLLPIHTAGNVGNTINNVLTVVSTNDPTGNNITSITFSGAAANDLNAILANDSLYFLDGVSGFPNLRYLTFIGQHVSGNPVQMRATSSAASDGAGNVTINIDPPLCATAGNANQNIKFNIVAGMQVRVLPDHLCGLMYGGDALMLAMPKMPEYIPFDSTSATDEDTGAAMRMTWYTIPGQDQFKMTVDQTWGKQLPGEYALKFVIPLSQI